ncbi:MAG TPA: methylated-DNA--[protein]-cysteine S-methyltransferase [Methylibium sp.]
MKSQARYIAQTTIETPLGPLLLARSEQGLAGAWFEGQKDHPGPFADTPERPDDPLLKEVGRQFADYWAGKRTSFDLPLDLQQGTPFQRAVWRALLGVGTGQTLSYGEIAERIGSPRAVRAVGAAVGRNPVSVIVPCHRIIGRDGSLTGYAGGLHRKTALLKLEGVLA